MDYNLFNNIKNMYNYKDRETVAFLGALGTMVGGGGFILSNQLSAALTCLSIQIFSEAIALSAVLGSEAAFKDVKNIRKIYDQVLENYIKLNKQLELKHPIELFCLYNYLYSNGYLSVNHKFQYNIDNAYDIESIYGANVINGTGCCRHINMMFHDILEKSGIENIILLGNSNITSKNIYAMDRIDELISKQLDLEKNQKLSSRQSSKIKKELGYLQKKLREKITYNSDGTFKVLVNHVISGSVFNEQICFLDPTNMNIHKRVDKHLVADNLGDYFAISYNRINFYNRGKKLNDLEEKIKPPEVSLRDKYCYLNKVSTLISECKDEFEKLYTENKEAYEEISDKLSKVKMLKRD